MRTVPLQHSFNAWRYRALTWLTGVTFAAALIYQTLTESRPPISAEARSILYGIWILQQHDVGAGSFTWTTGATLWPIIVATATRLDGLLLARSCACACAILAFAALVDTARYLFDDVAALWTAVALALSGALTQQAQTATAQILAFSGISISLWGIARAIRRNNRGWLIVAGTSYAMALLAMYGAWFCIIPFAIISFALRRPRWKADLLVFAWAAVTTLLMYITPESQLFLQTLGVVSAAGVRPLSSAFASAGASIGFLEPWYALPAVIGLGGLALVRGNWRWVAVGLLVGLALGAVYDLVYPTQPAGQTFSLLGDVFGIPLCGMTLAHMWNATWGVIWSAPWRMRLRRLGLVSARVSVALIVILLGFVGGLEAYDLDNSQPPMSPAMTYALSHVQPGERLLVAGLNPIVLALYQRGTVTSLTDVYDLTRAQQTGTDLCTFDWIIVTGISSSNAVLEQQAQTCGDYAQVYLGDASVRAIRLDGSEQIQQMQDAIYVNVFTATRGSG